MKRQNQKALAKKWATTPIGTEVIVMKDGGVEVRTKTRSGGELLAGNTAVIWLEGISGCYSLERVRLA